MNGGAAIRWSPQQGPQIHAIDVQFVQELLFGGARGGGKSDFLLGDFTRGVELGVEWRGILFRRTYPELEELISRSKLMYPENFPGCEFREGSKTWHFPSGATLRMRYLEREADASRYQGHQYSWIGWVQDNQIMLAGDPGYIDRLKLVGSAELVRAWLEGDWSIVEGAYFDNWSTENHVLRPFEMPKHWSRFRSFDWGSARPFSVGWWAVASESFETPDGRFIPTGAMVRYREWYGAKEPNVGLKMTVEDVGNGIAERSQSEDYIYSVADPAIFIEDGGPSIAERMLLNCNVAWMRGDNKRIPGWEQLRQRLTGEDGLPMIYAFSSCADSIRTIAALQHSDTKPEDLDSNGEDHAADEWRYAVMSRPWQAATPVKPEELRMPTFDELRDMAARERLEGTDA